MAERNTLKIGDLVEHRNGSIGRVESIWPEINKPPYVYINGISSYDTSDGYETDFSFISGEPAISSAAHPLDYRRKLLEKSIGNLFSNPIDRGSWERRLYDTVFCPNKDTKWFWRSLACGANNPRAISYAVSKDIIDNDKRRKSSSWNKFLSGIAKEYGLDLCDSDIKAISSYMGGFFPTNYTLDFRVVYGQDVVSMYCEKKFGSCMYNCREFLQFYAINPDSVGLLCLYENNDLISRALLWKTKCGATVMDRVYPTDNSPHYKMMVDYAVSQGWDYRTKGGDYIFKSKRTDYEVGMLTSELFPYMDSFQYSNDNPRGTTVTLNTESGYIDFCDTAGGYCGRIPEPCNMCGVVSGSNERCYLWGGNNQRTFCMTCLESKLSYLNYWIRLVGSVRNVRNILTGFTNTMEICGYVENSEVSTCKRCHCKSLTTDILNDHCLRHDCETQSEYNTRMGITTNEPVTGTGEQNEQELPAGFPMVSYPGESPINVQPTETFLPSNTENLSLWGRSHYVPFVHCPCELCVEARSGLLSQPGFTIPV